MTTIWLTATFGLFTYLAEFVHQTFAVPAEQAGLIYVVVGAVGLVATRVSGRAMARLGPRRLVLTGISLFLVGALLLPVAPNLLVAILLFGVWAFGTWLGIPAQQTIVSGLSDRSRGTMLAFNSSAINLGSVLGPIATGRVIETFGFAIGARWAAAIGVVALAVAWFVLPRRASATFTEAPGEA
jgi:predicted MFS family arabinose efflux permease